MDSEYNINFIDIKLNKKNNIKFKYQHDKNLENIVSAYFESKGYNVININPRTKNNIPDFLLKKIKIESGCPDLYIYNEKTEFFVEVKKDNSGLGLNQIEWILENKYKCLLAVCSEQTISKEIIKENNYTKIILKNKLTLEKQLVPIGTSNGIIIDKIWLKNLNAEKGDIIVFSIDSIQKKESDDK